MNQALKKQLKYLGFVYYLSTINQVVYNSREQKKKMKAYCDKLCKVVKELDDEMSRPENLKNFRKEAQEIICKRKFEDPEVIKN